MNTVPLKRKVNFHSIEDLSKSDSKMDNNTFVPNLTFPPPFKQIQNLDYISQYSQKFLNFSPLDFTRNFCSTPNLENSTKQRIQFSDNTPLNLNTSLFQMGLKSMFPNTLATPNKLRTSSSFDDFNQKRKREEDSFDISINSNKYQKLNCESDNFKTKKGKKNKTSDLNHDSIDQNVSISSNNTNQDSETDRSTPASIVDIDPRKGEKRNRKIYLDSEIALLEKTFLQSGGYPNKETVKGLHEKLSVSEEKIRNWFQNRRAKHRRENSSKKTENPIKTTLSSSDQQKGFNYLDAYLKQNLPIDMSRFYKQSHKII